jgi:phenylpropionate dioxygenase-like ring-hydroxylating dioxygenase large terminal subunit
MSDPVLENDWHPVCSLHQLRQTPVIGTRLLGEDVVIWRTGDDVHVWADLCIHRGSRLSLGKVVPVAGQATGCLQCLYHGWTYSPNGECVNIPAHPGQTAPAKARTQALRSAVKYGMVWASPGNPAHEVPPFPEADAGMTHAVCGPFAGIRALGPRLIENYIDAAHFPFVHEGVLGDPKKPHIGDYEARITPRGVESDPITVYQPDPYKGAAGEVTYQYNVFRPLTAHFTKRTSAATNGMVLTITPHDNETSTGWFIVATTAMNDSERLRVEYTPRIGKIFDEDRAIVEGQRPELLPLDLQAELHLRSDRVSIAYRTWLRQLGMRWGVS